MTRRPTSAAAPARAWLVPAAFVLFCAALAPAWSVSDGRDAWRSVYFERAGEQTEVHTGAPAGEGMVPHVYVDASGVLQVPEGYTVAVPMQGTFTIEQEGGGLPLIALARDGGGRLETPWTPGEGGGQAFEPDRPWRQEAARLEALTASCGPGDGLVVVGGPSPELRFGRCLWAPSAADELLILGADRWKRVQRTSAPFARPTRLRSGALTPCLALAAVASTLLAWGLGGGAATSTGGVAILAGLLAPHVGVLIVAVGAFVGLLACGVRVLRRFGARAAAAAILLAGGAAASPSGPTLLAGYSTVEGDGLRPGRDGPDAILQAACPALGTVRSVARAGGSIDWLSEELCIGGGPEGGTVVMLGGTNDDFLWGLREGGAGGAAALALVGLRSTLAPSDWSPENVAAFYRAAAERTEARIPTQVDAYRRATACSLEAGNRFLLAQNFLVTDLRGDRSAPRAAIVRARLDAVEAAGGASVDLLADLGDQAALSWFADHIHLTAVGHDRAARAICSALGP